MARLSRFAILTVTLLFACASFATTYYIAANGSDSNNGTSKTTPWQHAPGMTGCSGTCAGASPQPGDQFIFRGGDTWHNDVFPWIWNWNGTSGSRIYIGVDQTWFAGASWSRPILNGDNPLSTKGVASCLHQAGGTSANYFVFLNPVMYVTFDNFEFTGLCWGGVPNTGQSTYLTVAGDTNSKFNIISNNYFHGWTHIAFNCSWNGSSFSGNCDGGTAMVGDSHQTAGEGTQYIANIVDGSDSDPTSFIAQFYAGYDVHNSVFRNCQNGATLNNVHTFHDNLIENLTESSDGLAHSNGFEFNTEWNGSNGATHTSNYVYNNLFRNVNTAVGGWVNPDGTDYYFNNVEVSELSQGWDLDSGGGGTYNLFNNTLQVAQSCLGQGFGSGWLGFFKNLHTIDVSPCSGNSGDVNEVHQTTSQANAQGYVTGNNLAPSAATNATVGAGVNLTSFCNGIPDAAVAAACKMDTTLACSYNATNHSVVCPARTAVPRPSSGAWDAGAYQYGQATTRPAPPSGLSATAK